MGTIAQKLEYLNDTRLLLKDNINKINNVLDDNSTFRSYPQELFNGYIDILNNGTDTLWNNLEKVSQTGTEAVLEGVETAPMKVELQGNTQQNGEPTPDTPIPVQVVTGENVVSVSGKNLLKLDFTNDVSTFAGLNFTHTDSVFTLNGTSTGVYGAFTLTNIIPIKSGKKYTFSINIAGTNPSLYVRLRGFSSNDTRLFDIGFNTKTINSITKDVIFDEEITRCVFMIENLSNGGIYDLTAQIQFEESTAKTDFVPYSKTDYPISLGTLELCKIGNYKDYLFKRNGKWYVHKEIGKVVLDGSESWTYSSSYSATSGYSYFYSNQYDNLIGYETYLMYSNYFGQTTAKITPAYITDKAVISGTNTNEIHRIRILTPDNVATSVSGFKTWLSTHNTIVYYVLATPTEEEITNTTLIEQLEAISKAKSVKDKTYITQTNDELPFILDVEAIKEYEVV